MSSFGTGHPLVLPELQSYTSTCQIDKMLLNVMTFQLVLDNDSLSCSASCLSEDNTS